MKKGPDLGEERRNQVGLELIGKFANRGREEVKEKLEGEEGREEKMHSMPGGSGGWEMGQNRSAAYREQGNSHPAAYRLLFMMIRDGSAGIT